VSRHHEEDRLRADLLAAGPLALAALGHCHHPPGGRRGLRGQRTPRQIRDRPEMITKRAVVPAPAGRPGDHDRAGQVRDHRRRALTRPDPALGHPAPGHAGDAGLDHHHPAAAHPRRPRRRAARTGVAHPRPGSVHPDPSRGRPSDDPDPRARHPARRAGCRGRARQPPHSRGPAPDPAAASPPAPRQDTPAVPRSRRQARPRPARVPPRSPSGTPGRSPHADGRTRPAARSCDTS